MRFGVPLKNGILWKNVTTQYLSSGNKNFIPKVIIIIEFKLLYRGGNLKTNIYNKNVNWVKLYSENLSQHNTYY